MPQPQQWWQTGIIYQVYPRSFQDTDANGIGDLPGITARLDYLAALGITALWISPFYPSPMADFGYDVANYTDVAPLFGTLADFDALLAAAHSKGLRVILDFVPNHTSDQHPWFLESRSSRTSPKRDWYLWQDAPPAADDGQPANTRLPNNWQSHFGGPVWTWDEPTQQFYLHSFLAQQPDLNWRNPEARAAMYAAMRFWLDKGVDGFRMDVLWLLIKDAHFRDNPADNNPPAGPHNADQPETHTIVAEMRALLDTYPDTYPDTLHPNPVISTEAKRSGEIPALTAAHAQGTASNETCHPLETCHPVETCHPERSEGPAFAPAPAEGNPQTSDPAIYSLLPTPYSLPPPASPRVLIGEIYLPLPNLVHYYGTDQTPEANLPFNFSLIQTPWNAAALAENLCTYESLLPAGAWPNYVLGNHDQSRLATRLGPRHARAAAMLLLTLRGTPTLYYGDELGMEDVPIAPDQIVDPAAKHDPSKGRDPERSPMLWVNAPNAGFTPPDATPWLPLMAGWPTRNAATQAADPKSMLTLYRTLLALRRQHDTLHAGTIADIAAEGNVLRYRRVALPEGESTDFQVLFNLGDDVATVDCAPGTLLLTTLLDGSGSRVGDPNGKDSAPLHIESGEGLLIALD